MKRIIFTRDVPTTHPELGTIEPGPNDIADDVLAERLLEAGRYTGDYVAAEIESPAAEAPSAEAIQEKRPRRPPRRRAREEE